MYYDYDYTQGVQTAYVSATTVYPLWAGMASPDQARRVVYAQPTPLPPPPLSFASSTSCACVCVYVRMCVCMCARDWQAGSHDLIHTCFLYFRRGSLSVCAPSACVPVCDGVGWAGGVLGMCW
jgi:hypothetical protein